MWVLMSGIAHREVLIFEVLDTTIYVYMPAGKNALRLVIEVHRKWKLHEEAWCCAALSMIFWAVAIRRRLVVWSFAALNGICFDPGTLRAPLVLAICRMSKHVDLRVPDICLTGRSRTFRFYSSPKKSRGLVTSQPCREQQIDMPTARLLFAPIRCVGCTAASFTFHSNVWDWAADELL